MTKRILSAWFGFHFTCLIAVSLYETARLIVLSETIVAPGIVETLKIVGSISEESAGSRFARSDPIRQSLVTYLAFSAADGGYGYFAPGYRYV